MSKPSQDHRNRLTIDREVTIEMMEGRKDIDYGALLGVGGLVLSVLGVVVSLASEIGALFVVVGLSVLVVGAIKFVKGIIAVRATRGL